MTAIVSGHVQGVGYRRFIQRKAIDLQLAGYAENRPEGRVEVIAEGPEEELKFLCQLLKKGPPHARVEGIEIQWSESTGLVGFYVY